MTSQVAEVVRRLRSSFNIMLALLLVVDRESDADENIRLVSLEGRVRPAQWAALKFLLANRWGFILKSRRLGCTTILAAYFFWRWLLTPNFKVAVIAHTHEAAESIFRIYKRFYDNLPDWLAREFPCDTSNVREMVLFHGGIIKVYSARTENIRGDGYHIIHCTEVSQWPNFARTVQAAFQAADGKARVIMETTAHGPNEVYNFWYGQGDFANAKGFAKLFFPWFVDPDYIMSPLDLDYVPPDAHDKDLELEYQATYNLTDLQMNWWRWCWKKKCVGSLDTLNQEYPAEVALAFLLSGKPYFRVHYDAITKEPAPGVLIFEEPLEWVPYLAGIDTATGSPDGDYSTVYIWRVGAEGDPYTIKLAASYYARKDIVPFAEDALDLCNRYHAFTTIETNGPGATVLQHFKHKSYPYLYITQVPGRIGKETTQRLGFTTSETNRPMILSAFQVAVNSHKAVFECPRLQHEINTFAYDTKGRPDHLPGSHSDAIMGSALALEGKEQAGELYFQDRVRSRRPMTVEEQVMYEVRTGRLYEAGQPFGSDQFTREKAAPSVAGIFGLR